MHWWEETEARIHRTASAATLGQALWQRLVQAGLDPDAAFLTACDLAALELHCADLVKLVDSLLQVADGDRAAFRRHALDPHGGGLDPGDGRGVQPAAGQPGPGAGDPGRPGGDRGGSAGGRPLPRGGGEAGRPLPPLAPAVRAA